MVEEWLPTVESNAAQSDEEVLELLLRQLGYPWPPSSSEVASAWETAVRAWRAKKAVHEAHLAGLRSLLETGSTAATSSRRACARFASASSSCL